MADGQLQLLRQILRAGAMETRPIDKLRRNYELFIGKFPGLEGVRSEAVTAGGVAGEWIDASEGSGEPVATVLYLHGGGFVFGSVASHRQLVARLSRAAGVRCLAIDYRLAPEHPFPAALDDAQAAYRWLLAEGVEPRRLAVAGDSAGAGLGVIAATRLRDAGEPLPAVLACMSPWADLAGTAPSLDAHAHLDPVVRRPGLEKMAGLYLDGTDPRDPRASALHADLRGLPPLLIHAGGEEALLDDARRLAERARRAGVEVELEVWPGMIHAWHVFAGRLRAGREAIERLGERLRARLPA